MKIKIEMGWLTEMAGLNGNWRPVGFANWEDGWLVIELMPEGTIEFRADGLPLTACDFTEPPSTKLAPEDDPTPEKGWKELVAQIWDAFWGKKDTSHLPIAKDTV